ncbi:hypothetical protein B0A48_16657 [Cryoendolithus antarcticus]|uniref:Uncharacterized protein n=1 Tax=Cryoendolithus antarcticus TaxID=1507870 RepID=A0A1V8SEB3_9PEZI|nr:hypothetical protein B0A48_16657 [Cryoendolithus antarcticus]
MADDVRQSIASDDACPSLSSDNESGVSSRSASLFSIALSTVSTGHLFKETIASSGWLYRAVLMAHEDLDDGDVDEVIWWETNKVHPRNWVTNRSNYGAAFINRLELIMTLLSSIGSSVAEGVVRVARATLCAVSWMFDLSDVENYHGTEDSEGKWLGWWLQLRVTLGLLLPSRFGERGAWVRVDLGEAT